MATKANLEPYFTWDSTPEELAAFDGKAFAENMRLELAAERKRLGMPTIEEELDAWVWEPNDEWRKLEGILADSTVDTYEARHAERVWELEHDERKFGPFPRKQ